MAMTNNKMRDRGERRKKNVRKEGGKGRGEEKYIYMLTVIHKSSTK